MKRIFLFILLLYFFVLKGADKTYAQGNWNNLSPSIDKMAWGGAAYDGKRYFYILGGYDENFNGSDRFHRYDIIKNKWEALSPSPYQMYSTKAMYADGNLYVIPGAVNGNSTRDFLRYEINNSSWSSLPNLPVGGVGEGGAAFDGNNYIYITGYTSGPFSSAEFERFYRYDINNNSWTQLTEPPFYSAHHLMLFDGEGRLYIVGGDTLWGNAQRPLVDLDKVQRFNLENQTWSILSSAPTKMHFNTGAYDDSGHFYITGGAATADEPYNHITFYRYTIANDTWERLTDTPEAMAANNGMWYELGSFIVTGGLNGNGQLSNALYRFKIEKSFFEEIAFLKQKIEEGQASGKIDQLGSSLTDKLDRTLELYNAGLITEAKKTLSAFINQVEAQQGKKIEAEFAEYLIKLAVYIFS